MLRTTISRKLYFAHGTICPYIKNEELTPGEFILDVLRIISETVPARAFASALKYEKDLKSYHYQLRTLPYYQRIRFTCEYNK